MFYQIFLSPQAKRCAVITYKHGIHKFSRSELRLVSNILWMIVGSPRSPADPSLIPACLHTAIPKTLGPNTPATRSSRQHNRTAKPSQQPAETIGKLETPVKSVWPPQPTNPPDTRIANCPPLGGLEAPWCCTSHPYFPWNLPYGAS